MECKPSPSVCVGSIASPRACRVETANVGSCYLVTGLCSEAYSHLAVLPFPIGSPVSVQTCLEPLTSLAFDWALVQRSGGVV
jgi:hypothetical protein